MPTTQMTKLESTTTIALIQTTTITLTQTHIATTIDTSPITITSSSTGIRMNQQSSGHKISTCHKLTPVDDLEKAHNLLLIL